MSKSASQTPNLTRKQVLKLNQGPAGAVDEDFFYGYFAQIETREISNQKELSDTISDITRSLKCHSEDWDKRVKALKQLQSVTSISLTNDIFIASLRQLQVPLQSCLSDLRSQVVREACLCVAFMAHVLKLRLEPTVDCMMPHLIGLVQNSAKVMATSGMVCLTIITKNIQSPKILLHVTAAMNSKSNTTRRFANELLETICSSWDTNVLTKQISNVEAALNKGLGDADQDVRSTCRSAFIGFAEKFPDVANKMMAAMESGRRSLLEKELCNHPVWEILQQSKSSARRRTSCPPTPLQSGERVPTATRSKKKNYGSDSGDELSTPRININGTPLSRSRARAAPDPSTSIMSRSMNTNMARSTMQTSTSNLSPRSYLAVTTRPTRTLSNDKNSNYMSGSGTYLYKQTGSASESMQRKGIPTLSTKGNHGSSSRPQIDPILKNFSSRKPVDSSDDNDSETSSVASSDLSRSSNRAHKSTANIQEIIRQLSSANWVDKKDGLINLKNSIQTSQLSQGDLKKIVSALNSLFLDSKIKIMHILLGCVQQMIEGYSEHLCDWLYTLLVNLLAKQASETTASQQKPIQDTLSLIRSQFPLDILVRDCCKIIGETSNNSGMKLKVSMLVFFKTVLSVCPAHILEHSLSSLTPTVNILIDWTFDSKWQEIRKISNSLLLKFHDLHPQLLQTISQCLPPIARQKVYNLVNQPFNGNANSVIKMNRDNYAYSTQSRRPSNPIMTQATMQDELDNYIEKNTEDLSALSQTYHRYDRVGGPPGSYNRLQVRKSPIEDSRSRNQDPLANSNASYMINRFQDSIRSPKYQLETLDSMGSCQEYLHNSTESLGNDTYSTRGYNAMSGTPMYEHVAVKPIFSGPTFDSMETVQNPSTGLQTLRKMSELPPNEMVLMILSELCYSNQRTEQRKACLMKLIKIIRDNSVDNWSEVFKTALMRLLETLKDNDSEIRCLTLRVLQELTKNMSALFENFTHLTVLKVLQTHKDIDKAVVRAAEECSQVQARCLSHKLCIRVLAEVVKEEDCRLTIGGLKMLLEVLKTISTNTLHSSMEDLMPGLICTTEHNESNIRKSSIFCLVSIHNRIGDNLWPYLTNMSSSKVRLLRLYIDKTKTSSNMSDSMCM